jgi:hypothetical protein
MRAKDNHTKGGEYKRKPIRLTIASEDWNAAPHRKTNIPQKIARIKAWQRVRQISTVKLDKQLFFRQ